MTGTCLLIMAQAEHALDEQDILVVDPRMSSLTIPDSFKRIPLSALNEKAKHELCLHLNVKDHLRRKSVTALFENGKSVSVGQRRSVQHLMSEFHLESLS